MTFSGLSANATVAGECVNLPTGAACTYDEGQKILTISTSGDTQPGNYSIVATFTATQQLAQLRQKTSVLATWLAFVGVPFALLGFFVARKSASIVQCSQSS